MSKKTLEFSAFLRILRSLLLAAFADVSLMSLVQLFV